MLLYIFIIYYISMSAECLCYITQVIFVVVDIHIHINLIKAVNKTKYIFLSHLDQHVTFPKPRWCDH